MLTPSLGAYCTYLISIQSSSSCSIPSANPDCVLMIESRQRSFAVALTRSG